MDNLFKVGKTDADFKIWVKKPMILGKALQANMIRLNIFVYISLKGLPINNHRHCLWYDQYVCKCALKGLSFGSKGHQLIGIFIIRQVQIIKLNK